MNNTSMKDALIEARAIDIPEIMKKEFFKCVRFDKELRILFSDFPKAKTKQYKIGDNFMMWMHRYNEGRKGANQFQSPEYKFPTELYECAREFGYHGPNDLARAWSYMRYLLETDSEIAEFQNAENESMSIQELVLSTLALVDGIMLQGNHVDMQDVMTAQLKNLLVSMGIEMRGRPSKQKSEYQTLFKKAIQAAQEGNESSWNAGKIFKAARSITGSIV